VTIGNPQKTLGIVLCGSLIVYGTIAIILIAYMLPLLSLQGTLIFFFLFLVFLLPSSYVYWRYRIDVKIIGPEPALAEPGDDLSLTVAIGFPRNASPKGAVLEAYLRDLNITTQKVEMSPTQLSIRVPEISPGYHKIMVQVSQEGYFNGSSSYEVLIVPGGTS
jgi:uncharacterized protein (DUF58 family)